MQVVRNFAKRETEKSDWAGDIGRIVLETDANVIKLNGKPLPLGSMEYLLTFALQAFQDAYAGASGLEEAKGFFEKKLEACIAGTIGVRGTGANVSDETRISRSIVKVVLKKQLSEEDFKALTDARLDEVFAKNRAKLQSLVDERMAELKKERERKAKLGKGLEIEL